MRLSTLSIGLAVFIIVPSVLSGQQVDPGVAAIDPSVHSRVQDPDQPSNALLPGGSNSWTGQPTMTPQPSSGPSAAAQRLHLTSGSNQFPSLMDVSSWTPSSSTVWAGNAPIAAAQPTGGTAQLQNLTGISAWGSSSSSSSASTVASSVNTSVNGSKIQGQIQGTYKWNRLAGFHGANPLTPTAAAAETATSARQSDILEELFPGEQNKSSNSIENLRKLKQSAARPARLKLNNPFQSKADASTAAHWGADMSSAYAMAQKKHESGMLLQGGFNARTERKKHRHHGAAANTATR